MRRILSAAAAMAVAVTLLPGPGTAHAAPQESRAPSVRPAEPDRPPGTRDDPPDRLADPTRDIGRNWRRSSDRAVTTSSDGSGLHVLVADASDGYRWRTAATLLEPGFPTDQWIGQFCVTGSGRRALVVYAPREFANRDELLSGGAFAAVVDLRSRGRTQTARPGVVGLPQPRLRCRRDGRALPPGHPPRRDVRDLGGHRGRPRRGAGRPSRPGQVTSLLPYRDGLAGAMGRAVVRLDRDGRVRELAHAEAPPHRLLADGTNGLAFQVRRGDRVVLNRFAAGRVSAVRTAEVGTERLRPGAGGTVYVVGTRAGSRSRTGLLGPVGGRWTPHRTVTSPPPARSSSPAPRPVGRRPVGPATRRSAPARSGSPSRPG